MLHLLKIEWLKLKNYRTFWILSALYVISNYGVNYIAYLIQLDISKNVGKNPMAKSLIGAPPFAFPRCVAGNRHGGITGGRPALRAFGFGTR